MNAIVTTLPEGVCRIEGVPRALLGRLMVQILHHPGLPEVWKLAPSEDETGLEVFGVQGDGQQVVWGLLAGLQQPSLKQPRLE